MKTTLHPLYLAVAGLSTMLAATTAQAQSNVTLYGRVVGGVEYIDKIQDPNTGVSNSLTRAADNQWGTSLFGFKGSEDLGAGLKAEFLLESGFGSKSGSLNGSALFNRRSYVGLSGAGWGSLRLGKNLLISNDVWFLDPTGQQFIGTATLVRGRNWQGASNVIEYATPNFGGFTLAGQLGLGEQPGNSKKLRSEGFSAAYVNQGLELRAIYTARYDANGALSDVYNFSKETIVGGTYRVGAAKLFAAVDMVKASGAAATAPSKLTHGWLGVRYDVTPQLTLIGAGYNVKADRVDGKATLLMVGADYNLSKRTFLYASLGGVNNSGTGNYAADVTVNGPGVGASQKAVYAGFGHSF